MVLSVDRPPRLTHVSEGLAELARRIQASVVLVRGSGRGSGSGVVWERAGLVMTNDHVVPGERAEILFGGGERLPARVVARSRPLDLALLEIDGTAPAGALVPVTVGDSSRARIGELVVAVGNPLGERNAVTLGIISGTGPIRGPDGPREALHVNITLRPGNSGGVLADTRARVLGIPSMVVGPSQALAIPSNVVQQFVGLQRA